MLSIKHHGAWPFIALATVVAASLGVGIFVAATSPPRTVVMSSGSEGAAFQAVGQRYREILARAGVTLQLRPSNGALENLARLRDRSSGVEVGIIQSGTTSRRDSPELETLGTIFYEPLFLIYRSGLETRSLPDLLRRRISIGPDGSGTRTIAREILVRNGIAADSDHVFGFTPQIAAQKLLAGEIDAAFILTTWDAPGMQPLLATDGIELWNFAQADAYIALFPYMTKLVVPAGIIDLGRNRPASDITVLALKASLAVRAELHNAIQFLLLDAATQVHSGAGVFHKAGDFPGPEAIDLPLSAEAQRFYKTGRPFLQDYLPFWIAALTGRLLVVLIPLAALLYPFFKLLPRTYDWIMQSKIVHLYDEIRVIEHQMDTPGVIIDANAMMAKLDDVDRRANRLRLPTAYASMVYMLRAHIDLVRGRLAARLDQKQN